MINIFPKKYFIFSSLLFLCGYLTTIIFPDFYYGTDYFYYIDLLEGKKTLDFLEPFTRIIFNIFSKFSNAELSYKALGIISLLSKSYFISLLLEKTKKAKFSIFLYVFIYFICFYSRYEIGSLRNAFGIDIFRCVCVLVLCGSVSFNFQLR